jgi:glycerol-3-phosphate dehydrogenase
MMDDEIIDIAIIGAGCIGSAIAQRLSKYRLNIALIEKEADVSMGATKANSGIIHAPYMIHGKMKEEMNMRGCPMFDEICPQIGIDFKRIGAIFCATKKNDLQILESELELCKKRGFPVELIQDKKKIAELEPQLKKNIYAVLHFPTAGIIIPFEYTVALAEHAVMNGVNLHLQFQVGVIRNENGVFHIYSNEGKILKAKTIINAAGVYSDKVEKMVGIETFTITPRRGEYILFDKDALPLNKIIFPTPNLESKGIVIAPTLHGNFFIGPNAHEIDSKEGNQTTTKGLNEIIKGAQALVKKLPFKKNITNFAGVRATANAHDFIIGATDVPNFINAAGIDSPGLSSSLAIAEKVEHIIREETDLTLIEKSNYIKERKKQVRFADLSKEELSQRIEKNPQWGNMICRCEQVTEAEIVEACHAPIPCTNADMIKRRLRPSMGRCQGGFCLPKVMKIISRERNIIYEQVTKSGKNSRIVFDRTKNITSEVIQGKIL